ncbi:MAG TPA: hypothetical protein VM754_10590 [Actinomycetota bacterium]|nr:hypothetical protein [Actinomycetota bacterium]
MPSPSNPLEDTLRCLSNNDEVDLRLSGKSWPPLEDRWYVLSDVLSDAEVVPGWVEDLLAGEARGRRDVAGSYLASWLAGMVAGTPAVAFIALNRAWPLEPESIAVHRHAGGWFDGMVLRSPEIWVLPEDPAAGTPHTVVLDPVERQLRLAQEVVRLVEPIFAAVRSATRFPTRSMWGSLADGIAGMALWREWRSGSAQPATWDRAGEFLDRLQERSRLLKARPALTEVVWSGGTARFAARGTCCLYFKVFDGKPDPDGEGYCTSCPFRCEDCRHSRWVEWLEEQSH